jgi:hypothetical protein
MAAEMDGGPKMTSKTYVPIKVAPDTMMTADQRAVHKMVRERNK